MLLTAGTEDKFNTMTASWGRRRRILGQTGCYLLYPSPALHQRIYRQRRTLLRQLFKRRTPRCLKLCGSVSGRDHDKIKEAGLTPVFIDGVPAFEEADTILICRKMYRTSMNPADFIDKDADSKFYPEKDYHDMYIAEIVKAVVAE